MVPSACHLLTSPFLESDAVPRSFRGREEDPLTRKNQDFGRQPDKHFFENRRFLQKSFKSSNANLIVTDCYVNSTILKKMSDRGLQRNAFFRGTVTSAQSGPRHFR